MVVIGANIAPNAILILDSYVKKITLLILHRKY
jgi:hypothetical protein